MTKLVARLYDINAASTQNDTILVVTDELYIRVDLVV